MQNDILTGNGAKSKPFFIFFGLKLYIVPPTAKPSEQTTRFCVWEAVRIVHKTYRPGPGGRELWQESAERTTRLMGVKATKSKLEGYPVTRVDILDHRGEEALGKPQGSYFTIDLTTFWQRKADFFERAVRAVGTELKALLPVEGSALVVGLGNAAMTPDAVGPLALDSVLITRHLLSAMPKQFAGFRPVSGLPHRRAGAPPAWSPRRRCGAWWRKSSPPWSWPSTPWPPAGAAGVRHGAAQRHGDHPRLRAWATTGRR